ncbi:hypothetical protein ACFPJ1_34240 [Kribbella qitaiheensis]|uniref:hypothetical protein n=1 Tax=Kribbella qitaiheensis TaxID=1544730 RepID=UPI003621F6A1
MQWIVATTAVDALDQGPHALNLAFAATAAAGKGAVPEWVLAGAASATDYGGPLHPAELSASYGVGSTRVHLLAGDLAPSVAGETNKYYQQQIELRGTEGSAWVSLNQGGFSARMQELRD